ncbi:unnamed protein product [Pneumocystis jirovecii]|uniref:Pru domain-containing protein n=1 Tax=Pneumocystis jirovecii TaxID=42068 RepID=L0PF39_PNEJI|nr:unnamed protein product [Pneumocystis jirovecii]
MANSSLENNEKDIEEYIVSFKAGKMIREGNSTLVKADTRKGMVFMKVGHDDLVHFCWKDRTTGVVEDDFIIFPDEAKIFRIKECPGNRVFALRFKSSMQVHFFWMQDLKSDKDQYYLDKINEIIKNHVMDDVLDSDEQDISLKTETEYFDNQNKKSDENISSNSKQGNSETETQNILHISACKNYSALSDVSVPDNFSNESFILTDILMPSEIISLLQNNFIQKTLFPNLPSNILSQIVNLNEKNLENFISETYFQQELRSLHYAIYEGKADTIISKFSSNNSKTLDVFFRAIIRLLEDTDQEMNITE